MSRNFLNTFCQYNYHFPFQYVIWHSLKENKHIMFQIKWISCRFSSRSYKILGIFCSNEFPCCGITCGVRCGMFKGKTYRARKLIQFWPKILCGYFSLFLRKFPQERFLQLQKSSRNNYSQRLYLGT